jgi:hypothetical protein
MHMSSRTSHRRLPRKKATRISVTLPPNDYDSVVRMAHSKRVSTAWIIRDAVEKYLSGDIPLLANLAKESK